MIDAGIEGWTGIWRLLVACVLGGILGLEREMTHHSAGLRTHVLVALGSACFLLVGLSIGEQGRIAQGVVTGVGFIGAGAILKEGLNVRGITTASSLWVSSAVGVMVATGMFPLAATATVISLLALLVSSLQMPRRTPDRQGCHSTPSQQ